MKLIRIFIHISKTPNWDIFKHIEYLFKEEYLKIIVLSSLKAVKK